MHQKSLRKTAGVQALKGQVHSFPDPTRRPQVTRKATTPVRKAHVKAEETIT